MPNDPAPSDTTGYPSGNPWPLLDRLRDWLPGASITPHPSNMRADAMDALAEIERLRALVASAAAAMEAMHPSAASGLGDAEYAQLWNATMEALGNG